MAWKRNKSAGENDEGREGTPPPGTEPGTEPEAAATPKQIAHALSLELEGMRSLLGQKEAQLQRALTHAAERDNEIERIKSRLQAESDQQVETRVAAVIDELLDVGDDLGRAIMAARQIDHNPEVIAGIALVRQSFGKRLQKLGVSRMSALGARFDPALHEAISIMSVDDPAQDGVILAVIREGFTFGGKVLREAHVAVGKLTLPQ